MEYRPRPTKSRGRGRATGKQEEDEADDTSGVKPKKRRKKTKADKAVKAWEAFTKVLHKVKGGHCHMCDETFDRYVVSAKIFKSLCFQVHASCCRT